MYFRIIFLINFISFSLSAQIGTTNVNVKTPGVTDFIRYGNISSASFNGELNTKIPLITVPINKQNPLELFLGYNASGFVPAKSSGIVGLNWHLNVGGVITREVKGLPDDQLGQPTTLQGGGTLDPNGFICGIKFQQANNPSNPSYYINDNIYNDPINVAYAFADSKNPNIYLYGPDTGGTTKIEKSFEENPDIFSFNFNGISGKFFMGYDGKIKVVTNEPNNLKVDVSGMSSQIYNAKCANSLLSSEIKITDNLGNAYYFGGLSRYLEYTVPMATSGSGAGSPVITSWFLKKIEYYETQSVINFNYRPDFVLQSGTVTGGDFCNDGGGGIYWHSNSVEKGKLFALSEHQNEDVYDYNLDVTKTEWGFDPIFFASTGIPLGYWQQTHAQASGSTGGAPTNNYSVQKKAILESITGEDFTINFVYGDHGFVPNNRFAIDGINPYINEQKLDNLTLLDKNNTQIKKINFEYSIRGGTAAVNSYPRLFLDKVTEVGKPPYVFDYFIDASDILPRQSTAAIDHWGFWNGKSSNDGGNFNALTLIPDTSFTVQGDYSFTSDIRDPNFAYAIKGQLKRITYPTGGYSEFEYEPHTYSKRLERRSVNSFLPSLYDVNGIVGGTRIQKITDFDGTVTTNIKEYKYSSNYPSATSSGILLQWPRYVIALKIHYCCGNNGGDKWLAHRNSNTINKTLLESSVINYSEVTEVTNGNGYIVNKYKDYITNPDKGTLNSDYRISQIFATIPYNQQGGVSYDLPELEKNLNGVFYSDNSMERGKLLSQKFYDDSGNPKLQTNFVYNNDTAKYSQYVAFTNRTGNWLQTLKLYYYNDYVSEKNTNTYTASGNIFTTEKFEYSSLPSYSITMSNQDALTRKYMYSSVNNEIVETQFKYPSNIYATGTTNYINFQNANIAVPLRESQLWNSVKLSEKFTAYIKDASTNNVLLPKYIYGGKFPNNYTNITDVGTLEKKITYDSYDTKGNVTQYTQENGMSVSVIWGYEKTLPIAKIENATYAQIATALGVSVTVLQGYNEANLTALNGLRTSLTTAMVTTYTNIRQVGVSTITDPKGNIMTYTYDSLGRLLNVKDKNNNVISQYQYHYKS
ncbi:hypothetical protein [Flavobacterium sp.]|uniref:hypothetical protein n=1 Tax=Flavobacterium sp. TaxID=239 RepID=UPI0038FC341B